MEIIRRDTDYAFRLTAQLAIAYDQDEAVSARVLAKENAVPYTLACKVLQKLSAGGIVESSMGPHGGFRLTKKPETIRFSQVIAAVQGPISVNKCLMGGFKCPMKRRCSARPKMAELQDKIEEYLDALTLKEFIEKEACND